MRSNRLSRPISFYALFIGVPLIVIGGVFTGLYFWSMQQPDNSPIQWSDMVPEAKLKNWFFIVLHHSDTKRGSTAGIDRHHREVNDWDGVGYHFVIGNGHGMKKGRIDYTFRWQQQREGAHAGGTDKRFNFNGIGICMIGDFEEQAPDQFQLQRCVKLCATLINALPYLEIESIIGHCDVPGKQTKCPGKYFDIKGFKQLVKKEIHRMNTSTP